MQNALKHESVTKNFDIFSNQFKRPTYFDGPEKLFSDLYMAKF